MTRFILAAALAALLLPAAAFAGNVTPDVIFGSGNANGSFTIDQNNGVELGLRGKLRHNEFGLPENTFNWDGVDTYTFSKGVAGPGGAGEWSYEWSINTDFDGSTGLKLDDLTYSLSMTSTNSAFMTAWDPINVAWWDHSIGDNTTANGGGAEAGLLDFAGYAALIAGNNVAQNSWKPIWAPVSGFDPRKTGEYYFTLEALDPLGNTLASTSITVRVVPLPAALWGALPLLGGLAVVRRIRRRREGASA